MRSSLSYAILALVANKPQTGYDLALQMRPPQGFIWQAKHGQIYPELARLVKDGLVRYRRIDTRSGPARKVHAVTPAGRSELSRWIGQSPQDRPANDELVIKAYVMTSLPSTASTTMLHAQVANHEARLAALEHRAAALQSRAGSKVGPSSSRFGEYAAVMRAIGAEREYLVWCRWLLSELIAKESKPPRRRVRAKRSPQVRVRRPA
jgi:DNA-binding PadR family transcriptional regulator